MFSIPLADVQVRPCSLQSLGGGFLNPCKGQGISACTDHEHIFFGISDGQGSTKQKVSMPAECLRSYSLSFPLDIFHFEL